MIKVLGSYGNRGKNRFTTSFLIRENIVIDAGNLSNGLDNVEQIEHIFLTHSHFDHILDIPFVIDTNFSKRTKSLKIYALKETINSIKQIFNNQIWPDFSKIKLLNGKDAIKFIEIEIFKPIKLYQFIFTPIPANHSVPAVGYKIEKNNQTIIISGDTYLNPELVKIIKTTQNLKAVFLECSFPSNLDILAKTSKHLTPKLIYDMKLPKNINLFFYHFKYELKSQIIAELSSFELIKTPYQILNDGLCIKIFDNKECNISYNNLYQEKLNKLMEIGVELSYENNINFLLDDILSAAREFTGADGGSIYLKKGDKLYFEIIQNQTLNTFMGGRKGKIEWSPLELFKNGKENKNMVAVLCALTQQIYNIPDVYKNTQFDFSGTKEFDKKTGYISKSMLVIPLINHKKETIGVLQLINKKQKHFIIPFTKEDEDISMSLASQAAVSITKNRLIDDLENFIESFINVIAKAIDEKSKYTSNHIQRVSKLAEIMSIEINKDKKFYPDIHYNKNMLKQIKISALLHDIGKITTDPRIMDKSTKLEKEIDRIEIIKERFEIIKRDLKIQQLKNKNNSKYKSKLQEIEEDFKFLTEVNKGGEFLSDKKIQKIEEISKKYSYLLNNKEVPILRDDEKEMLKIKKGTLSENERKHIQRHALMTLEMLSNLPFPSEYSEIIHIASNHHEKPNGKGYPRGLSDKNLTLEDKLLAICDIFEALSSTDRPYKESKTLEEVLKIMEKMADNNEIDKKLFQFFKTKKIWEKIKKGEKKED